MQIRTPTHWFPYCFSILKLMVATTNSFLTVFVEKSCDFKKKWMEKRINLTQVNVLMIHILSLPLGGILIDLKTVVCFPKIFLNQVHHAALARHVMLKSFNIRQTKLYWITNPAENFCVYKQMKKIKTVDTILCYKVNAWIASDYKFIVLFRKSFVYFSRHILLPLGAFINLLFEEKMVWNKANIFSIWKFCEFNFFCAIVHSNAFRVQEIWVRRKTVVLETEMKISSQTRVWPSFNLKILTKVLK